LAAPFNVPAAQLTRGSAQQLPKAVDHASADRQHRHTAKVTVPGSGWEIHRKPEKLRLSH
jgi:hypothetical protein